MCRTAPIDGTARYSSRCRREFHPKVATRSPGRIPSSRRALASGRDRSTTSPYVERSAPSEVMLTTSRGPNNCSARSAIERTSSGVRIIRPSKVVGGASVVTLYNYPATPLTSAM